MSDIADSIDSGSAEDKNKAAKYEHHSEHAGAYYDQYIAHLINITTRRDDQKMLRTAFVLAYTSSLGREFNYDATIKEFSECFAWNYDSKSDNFAVNALVLGVDAVRQERGQNLLQDGRYADYARKYYEENIESAVKEDYGYRRMGEATKTYFITKCASLVGEKFDYLDVDEGFSQIATHRAGTREILNQGVLAVHSEIEAYRSAKQVVPSATTGTINWFKVATVVGVTAVGAALLVTELNESDDQASVGITSYDKSMEYIGNIIKKTETIGQHTNRLDENLQAAKMKIEQNKEEIGNLKSRLNSTIMQFREFREIQEARRDSVLGVPDTLQIK